MKYDSLIPIIGSWSELLGDMFYEPELTQFSKDLKIMTSLPFEEVHGDRDYFKVFRETPLDKVKAVYVKDRNDSPLQQIKEIEMDIFELNFEIHIQEDLSWLSEQGILILPQQFTWGDNHDFHLQWTKFTTEVIRRLILHQWVCVCTKNTELIKSIQQTNSEIKIIDIASGCWSGIKTFIDDESFIWAPPIDYKM